MTRVFAFLVATAALVAGSSGALAQVDTRDIMGGGPNFRGGGSSPIPRSTVSYASNYSPGTIVINTAERRVYLGPPHRPAPRYGIGVGRGGFCWGGPPPPRAKEG